MKPFDYYKVTEVGQAISLLAKYQGDAAILAGGSDLFGLLKDRIEGPKMKAPKALIDIKGIKQLAFIREENGGLKIGAATTLADLIASGPVGRKYPLLVEAARQVAVPQIRNVGTIGGNLCQRSRCWYFRGRNFADCLRKGGGSCFAASGESRYHAIFGNDLCAMACVSDLAPALTALGASVEIAGPKGTRKVPVEQFHISPDQDVTRETVLSAQEMLSAIEVPAPAEGARGVYLKVKDRQAFDFAMVSVAINLKANGGKVVDSRIVFGGLAAVPLRSLEAERALNGRPIGQAAAAACSACATGATPLKNNAYKVRMAEGALEEALGLLA